MTLFEHRKAQDWHEAVQRAAFARKGTKRDRQEKARAALHALLQEELREARA